MQESTRITVRIRREKPLQLRRLARIDQAPQLLSRLRRQIQMRRDAVEYLDVVYRNAVVRLQFKTRQNLGREPQHFEVRVVTADADQLTTELRVLAPPFSV